MHWVMVNEVHVLLKAVMHEGDSIVALIVIQSKAITLIFIPFDLVTSDAVHATTSHAVGTARSEEPKSCIDLGANIGILNSNFVCELMVHLLTIVHVIVGR